MIVRDATEADLPAFVDIYNDVIASTSAVWRDDPVELEDRLDWFRTLKAKGHVVLVALIEDQVAGYASSTDFRSPPGYHPTVELSIHVERGQRGSGVGSALLDALTDRLRTLGKSVMVAGIDGGNAGSIRFHSRHGFVEVARMPGVGRKFGQPVDLVLMQRTISA